MNVTNSKSKEKKKIIQAPLVMRMCCVPFANAVIYTHLKLFQLFEMTIFGQMHFRFGFRFLFAVQIHSNLYDNF